MVAASVMKLGGLITVLVLGGFLFLFWRQDIMTHLKGAPAETSQ